MKVIISVPDVMVDLELFQVDIPMYLKREVLQAVKGDIYHNGLELDFGGLTKRK